MDFAINSKFYELTTNEYGAKLKELTSALPKKKVKDLVQNDVILYHEDYRGQEVFTVDRVTPSGKQAIVRVHGTFIAKRVTSNQYDYYGFTVLNEDLTSLIGVHHRNIVEKAVELGLIIPPKVRVEYPELFVELPERFKIEGHKQDRLRDFLFPSYGKPVTKQAVLEMINSALKSVETYQRAVTKYEALNVEHVQDYKTLIEKYLVDVDFYRWVLPFVSEGGIFHVSN